MNEKTNAIEEIERLKKEVARLKDHNKRLQILLEIEMKRGKESSHYRPVMETR